MAAELNHPSQEPVELRVLGVTVNEIAGGIYAVLLETLDGRRRVPIVVGMAEAQSIAVRLEGLVLPRPLTHDTLVSVLHAFAIELRRVVIDKLVDGAFHATLDLADDSREATLDVRTSDALAIALRTGAPIFITPDILERASYIVPENANDESGQNAKPMVARLEDLSLAQLQQRLDYYVEHEKYEKAAQVQKIIAQKTENGADSN